MLTAEEIIRQLELEPLDQEGGFFRQTFRSPIRLENRHLQPGYLPTGDHPLGTVVFFLMTADSFSAMHRLPTPETWFYHLGDPMEMLLLHPNGTGETVVLGADLVAGQRVQYTCPAHSWQGSRLQAEGKYGYILASAAMSPGFEWADFELGETTSLVARYPAWEHAIRSRVRAEPPAGSR